METSREKVLVASVMAMVSTVVLFCFWVVWGLRVGVDFWFLFQCRGGLFELGASGS